MSDNIIEIVYSYEVGFYHRMSYVKDRQKKKQENKVHVV